MKRVLLKDPRADRRDAYDVLAPVGVDACSTMDEILEASFRLMESGGMSPTARAALAELRDPTRRAIIDFFLHSFETPAPEHDLDEVIAQYGPREGAGEPDLRVLLQLDEDWARVAAEEPFDLRAVARDLVPSSRFICFDGGGDGG